MKPPSPFKVTGVIYTARSTARAIRLGSIFSKDRDLSNAKRILRSALNHHGRPVGIPLRSSKYKNAGSLLYQTAQTINQTTRRSTRCITASEGKSPFGKKFCYRTRIVSHLRGYPQMFRRLFSIKKSSREGRRLLKAS